MEALTVAATYGGALFEAARDREKTGLIAEEIAALDGVFEDEPSFFALVCSPSIDAAGKKGAIGKVFGDRISPELLSFMFILIDKRRIGQFHSIAKAYRKRMNESLGVSVGAIYSAAPLPEGSLARFEEKTGRLVGGKVRLESFVDEGLIGGVKILIEGKLIDASIKKRLESLKEQLV
ncbi:MAG: ATP synthase F1 subunit delta [Clostridiales Family XIII bacterium]|jgi:ATP synthase F1 delta subunit|nr:ATP synthase F1 subunit delta [Clostridiales Family XIII bacterium]